MIGDRARTVWLFGRPYWWDTEEQRLVLRPADWLLASPPPAPEFEDMAEWWAAHRV